LWAQQNLELELAQFRLSEPQRAAAAQRYELAIADETLAAERSRLAALAQNCPGDRQTLMVSSGDRVRDGVRIRAQGDAARLNGVAQLALADWQLRRAQATGEAARCDVARQTLASSSLDQGGAALDAPEPLGGSATVARDASGLAQAFTAAEPLTALSLYAAGFVDGVTAAAPLPHYLAAVYGGSLSGAPTAVVDRGGRTAEQVVDDLAPRSPQWEPDALYEALRAR
jgi:hypothetical protein